MKLLNAQVTNFGSYDNLEFSYTEKGLSLIYGATGSGKSTLLDIAPWILFGRTAKDGAADDVRSWTAPEVPTFGMLTLQGPNITVTRVRGKANQNDLYWEVEGSSTKYRGKDLAETQTLLNEFLGLTYESFVIASYYNEFSPTGSFFTAKAADRRELFENLANLDLPVKLAERIADAKKDTRKTLTQVTESLNRETGRLDQLQRQEERNLRDAQSWGEKQERKIQDLELKNQQFEEKVGEEVRLRAQKFEEFEQTRLEQLNYCLLRKEQLALDMKAISDRCLTCGEPSKEHRLLFSNHDTVERQIDKLSHAVNPHAPLPPAINTYIERLEEARKETNPYLSQTQDNKAEIAESLLNKNTLQNQVDSLKHRADSLIQLHKITEKLRENLRKNTISLIEDETNRYLSAHFDAEIRVVFSPIGADNIDVFIWKSGHECSYSQLSKGQRSLLKLAFAVSCMKAASNKLGVDFNVLMFDEPADGADTEFKIKAYQLFEELALSHESVFLIDHNEAIQSLCNSKYCVKINSDISTIAEV